MSYFRLITALAMVRAQEAMLTRIKGSAFMAPLRFAKPGPGHGNGQTVVAIIPTTVLREDIYRALSTTPRNMTTI